VDGLLSPKKSVLYLPSLNSMPCHITWTATHSSFPTSPRQFSHDISWYCLYSQLLSQQGRHVHTHVCLPNMHGNSSCKSTEQERRNAARPVCYARVGKDRERRLMGHYRCEHTAAVEADRIWSAMLNGHRVMGQRTTQGGSREACVNVISGSPSCVSCPEAPDN